MKGTEYVLQSGVHLSTITKMFFILMRFCWILQRLEGRVLAGKVNCNAFRHLCHQAGVSGYPTVMLYYGSDRHYQGNEIQSQSADYIIAHTEHVISQQQQSHLSHDEF